MLKKSLFLLFLALLLLPSASFAWFNDTVENDTCLVVESDKKVYRPNADGEIFVEYRITNDCGKSLLVNVAEFVESRHSGLVQTTQFFTATTFKETQVRRHRDNGGDLEFYYVVRQDPIYNLANPSKSLANTKGFDSKPGFVASEGYQNISVPEGTSYVKTTMVVPKGEGEWVLTLVDVADGSVFSTLDPTFTGSGTAADPYVLTTCQDVQNVAPYCLDQTVFFELGNDIDCTAFGLFEPICGAVDANEFRGHFDGQGYTISGVHVESTTNDRAALFQSMGYGGSVVDLGMADFNIFNQGNQAAGLVNICNGCDINSVFITGSIIEAKASYVGGLASYVINCGDDSCDANITNVYIDSSSVIGDTSNYVGGITSRLIGSAAQPSKLVNVRSSAVVQGAGATTGGIVALVGANTFAASCYWDTEVSGEASDDGDCTGLTTANSYKQASYDANWDFTPTTGRWVAHEDTNYPSLTMWDGVPPPSSGLDVNIVAIDGNSFFATLPIYSSQIDTVLTIDFNVVERNNARLTVDLNYSLYQTQGTGSVIITDLNLDSGVCLDLNFSDGNTTCSHDWDITGVPDGNYFILAVVRNASEEDFNASVKSVGINTGMDLNVLVPINEETGLPINAADEVSYYFNVGINDGNVLTIYNENSDANIFQVRTATSLVIGIDTNASAVFYGRNYVFTFPSTQTSGSLQPYLVPVASGILTTIKVQRFENLTALPGVGLRVYKFLPSGRTLVHQGETDFKGEAAIPFVIADAYEIEVWQDGELVSTQPYTATSTTSSYYIFISDTGDIVVPVAMNPPRAVFSPGQAVHSSTDMNILIALSSEYYEMYRMTYWVQNHDVNLLSVTDLAIPSDANTYTIILGQWVSGADLNYFISVNVILTTTNGNEFFFTKHYTIVDQNNPLYVLMFSSREMFGCSANLASPCGSLMFVAFFFMFLVLAGLSAGIGPNGTGLSIMAILMTAFFVFVGWIVLWIGFFMALACLGVIMARERYG